MKKLGAFGLLVLVLALSFAFIACGSGTDNTTVGGGNQGNGNEDGNTGGGNKTGGNGGGNPYIPTPPAPPEQEVLTFTDGEYTIEMTKIQSSGRAAVAAGSYTYKVIYGGEVISEGTVTVVKDTSKPDAQIFNFVPEEGSQAQPFTATFQGGTLAIEEDIIDKDGESHTIQSLYKQDNDSGIAKTRPEHDKNNQTIAGIKYSDFYEEKLTYSSIGTHYLIPGTWEEAYNALVGEWGDPMGDRGIRTDNTAIAEGLMNGGKGVLFEVSNSTQIYPDITYSYKAYSLAVRVVVVLDDGSQFSFWKVATWDGPRTYTPNEGEPYGNDGVGNAVETSTQIGPLSYTRKQDYPKIEPILIERTEYTLEDTYEEALDILKKLWGVPWVDGESNTGELVGVLFIVSKYTYTSDGWTSENYELVKEFKVDLGGGSYRYTWNGVRWWFSN